MKKSSFLSYIFAISIVVGSFLIAHSVSAVTRTVCASGCDHTTITAAEAAASAGDTIQIQTTYDRSTETFPVNTDVENLTFSCDSGATIGQSTPTGNNTFQLYTSSTVTGCTLSNINLYTASNVYRSGITITGNSVASNATGTIGLASQIRHLTISNNRDLDTIALEATSTDVTISGNTFYGDHALLQPGLLLSISGTSTQLSVTSNYFSSRFTTTPWGMSRPSLIVISSTGLTFSTNTVRYLETPPSSVSSTIGLSLGGGTHIFSGNKVETTPFTLGALSQCEGVILSPLNNMTQTIVARFHQNTFRNRCNLGKLLRVSDNEYSANIAFYVSSTNNIFDAAEQSTTEGAMTFDRTSGNTLIGTIDRNAVYGTFGTNRRNNGSADVEAGSNYYTINPHRQIADVPTSNDLDVAPYSIYLNIDGAGTKIGATTTTRRSTIYIDDNGTIDYSTVDALTPNSVTTTLRSGDTLNIAAGTYGNFSIQSDHVTSSLTIAGAGATTIINAGTNQHALSITGVTSTAISGLVLQNASSVQSIYTSTRMNFAYGGNNYADAIAPLALSSNQTVYVGNADLDSVVIVSNDGDSVTSAAGMGSVNYHLVLVDFGGSKATFLVPNSLFTSYAEANAAWGGFGITIDRFVTSTLSVSGGEYTYDSSAVAAAGVTLIGGLTTPAISRSSTGFAGLKLVNTGIATITNVTSTQNGYGIWFASGDGSTISDSILSSNTIYDVRQDANATNTLDNVTFTRVSSTVTGAGPILVKYDARVRLLRQGGTAISGASASSTSGGGTVTSLGSTDGSGYTSYVSLDAHRITSGSSSLTNGGFNPYTLNAVGTNYFSSSTTATLSSPNQTVTLALWSNQSPTAPTSATGTSLATTSVTLGWTDNSDDETSFLVDYRSPGAGQSYPGTTGTITSGNSTSVSGLTPGQTYEFRVAAVNSNGTSTYATSSQFTLPAATPAAPTVTVLSSTSLSVDLDTNGNATSVQYALYSAAVGGYINASGTVTSTASWNTSSTWGTLTISNLTCNTSYSFLVTARNTVSVETATSSASTATTSACTTSGGGGGGGGGGSIGGGGGVGGIGFVLPGTVTPAPIRLPPVVPVAPTSSPIVRETQPLAPPVLDLESRERLLQALGVTQNPGAENRSLVLVRQDAREFSVALSDVQANRFALFIAYGTSPETRRLGEGERRALIRDMLETMQRADLSVEDMQRLTMGEIPRMRNLAVERQQLPRVRQTFRTLFGHDPNFQNPQENLAWNTLMYRIRFNRDLVLEQQGIREFRSVFGRSPSTPFQWATVRVQGYVQR